MIDTMTEDVQRRALSKIYGQLSREQENCFLKYASGKFCSSRKLDSMHDMIEDGKQMVYSLAYEVQDGEDCSKEIEQMRLFAKHMKLAIKHTRKLYETCIW
tara:strand:+ start:1461 stop:1763 length:303 start_codon:yes stop_codon:yes gene_type:complete